MPGLEVKGLDSAIRDFQTGGAKTEIVIGGITRKWAEATHREARRRAPSDLGTLPSSIYLKMTKGGIGYTVKIGSDEEHAHYMEYGTGRMGDPEVTHKSEHWPPWRALEPWARRHGFPPGGGYLVARAIGLRGGLRPRRFLRGAWDKTKRMLTATGDREALDKSIRYFAGT